MNKNKIIKEGKKPILHFKCEMCTTEWETDNWRVEEQPTPYLGIMFSPSKIEKPYSRRSICGLKSFNVIDKK